MLEEETSKHTISAWSPLRVKLFRAIWFATILTNTALWMHEVSAGWLMTLVSDSPIMVALVQSAITLPILFFAMPAGVLSDILDRKKYLIVIQIWMVCITIIMGFITYLNLTNEWLLLSLTFAMGVGSAMMAPAWGAILPEVVPRKELAGAIALNSLSFNSARAIGPVIAGILIASFNVAHVYLINTLVFILVIYILFRWKRTLPEEELPAERFFSAMRVGTRFILNSHYLKASLIRASGFFLFASSLWALLPLYARDLNSNGDPIYPMLVSSIGAGAMSCTLFITYFRRLFSSDQIVAGATIIFSCCLFVVARTTSLYLIICVLFITGAAWTAVYSTIQFSAQMALPKWVRSRGVAVFLMIAMGAMGIGSLLWGAIAEQTSINDTLIIANIGAIVFVVLLRRFRLTGAELLDMSPSMHWETPVAHKEITFDRGPLMVLIRYKVLPKKTDEFVTTLRQLKRYRQRDGAFAWNILQDSEDPNIYFETYMMESWVEHLRQQKRATKVVKILQASLSEMLKEQPSIRRMLVP